MTGQWVGFPALMPIVVASVWAIVVLLAEMFSVSRRYRVVSWLSIVGLAHVAVAACCSGTRGAFGSVIALDGFTVFFIVLTAALSAVCILAAMDYLDLTEIVGGEYYPLLLFAFVGIAVMAAATDLIVLFLGLETMSVAVYVLAGIWKRDARSNEAALKYFVMGAFASGFMLYGIALLYGATGSTVLAEIASGLGGSTPSGLALLGMGMLTVGLAFKVSAVPFHLWTPDAYEGAPISVTAFMSTAVKAAGFAASVRILSVAFAATAGHIEIVLSVLAILTMTVGNFVALRQTSLKRMLAYSSIAHTGYLLVGLAAGTTGAAAAILFYLAAYGAMNVAAFAVLMLVARRGERVEEISDLAGLATSRPLVAAAMTIAMLSLTGIPPFGGFTAKLYLFSAALEAGKTGLVLVALGNSVVSAAYYLGVVKTMYFDPAPATTSAAIGNRPYLGVALAIAIVITILLGVAPSAVLDAAANAMEGVLTGAAG
jgi:NADH-quinone oxidoreductase subunit N